MGVWSTALACSEQACERHFLLQEVREVRLAEGGYLREASGLTGFGGYLWTVSDKNDTTIYRLDLSSRERVAAAQEIPLHIAPAIRQALSACRSHRGDRLDLEGIAADAGGLFFLLSENYRAILITDVDDPSGPAPRATVKDVLCVPERNLSANDGLEGLSAFSGGLLALEEGKGSPTKRLYRCLAPDRHCSALPFPALDGRTPDLSFRDPHGTRLLVLNTAFGLIEHFNKICEVQVGDQAVMACVLDLDRVKEGAKSRDDVPESFRREGGMNYEGIHFDAATGRLYIINDNNAVWNRIFHSNVDLEPTFLLIFTSTTPP
ncbi:MAG: esterase-like activity of phytase family protein [Candidatus Methylomirabilales bacterium]